MNWTRGMLTFAAVCGLLIGSNAVADEQDPAGAIKELKQDQQELRSELDGVKKELQAVRGDLQKIVAELKALKAKQNQPQQKRERPAEKLLGKPAPQHSATTTEGKEIQIGGTQDKPQVLFFYASWCGYSKRAMPGMETLHQDYKDKGVDVISISLDERGTSKRARTEEQTLAQFQEAKCTMPLILDNEKKIGKDFKVQSFPNLFVVGKSGTIESVHIGAKAGLEKTVAAELDVLLQGKTRADFPGAKEK